jgi:hypothetical protein
MNTIYLLNGPPRTAKSTIMNSLITTTKVQLIAGDALEHGLRNVLTGEPHQLLQEIEFSGTAEYKSSFTEIGERKPFSNSGTESTLLLQMIVGMLDYYRRNKESVAFEGTEFSPKWVYSLDVPGVVVKAAYVGYTNAQHIDSILSHAQKTEHDWINEWLQKDDGDDSNIRAWVQKTAQKCSELKSEAEAHGYPFFDISKQPFEDYKSSVLNYFLQS